MPLAGRFRKSPNSGELWGQKGRSLVPSSLVTIEGGGSNYGNFAVTAAQNRNVMESGIANEGK